MPVIDNDKDISCAKCKHYQPDVLGGYWNGDGECRALPPVGCCAGFETAHISPKLLVDGRLFWCSAWMQSRGVDLGVPRGGE